MRRYAFFLLACAGPVSSRLCLDKDAAKRIVEAAPHRGNFSVLVQNHVPEQHDSKKWMTELRGELAGNGAQLRDEAECDRFLRVTLEKKRTYVEVIDRKTRHVDYVHEYTCEEP